MDGSGTPPESRIRVVIADDHVMVRDSLARMLSEEADLEVVGVAATGGEAIALTGELHPDVVIIDYILPDKTGIDVIRQLTSTDSALRAVLITGSGNSQELAAAAIYAGCSGIVEKTRALPELADSVRRAVRDEVLVQREQLVELATGRVAASTQLTPREHEVLALVAEGRGTKDIAASLGLSVNSVRNLVQRLLVKLDAHSKLEAVVNARRRGIL
jgi:DNA-binding NarL/FixJ family response regulator